MNVQPRFSGPPPGVPRRPADRPGPPSEPPPDPTPPPYSSHTLGTLGLVGLGTLTLLSAGCTQQQPQLPQTAELPNPSLEVLPDGVPRVDLRRVGPDSQVGVNLGSGIFQDANGNVQFVPQLGFGDAVSLKGFKKLTAGPLQLAAAEDGAVTGAGLTVTAKDSELVVKGKDNEQRFTRVRNVTTVKGKTPYTVTVFDNGDTNVSFGSQAYKIKKSASKIYVDGPGMHDWIVQRKDDWTSVEGLGFGNKTWIHKTANGFSVEGPAGSWLIAQEGEGGAKTTSRGPANRETTILVGP